MPDIKSEDDHTNLALALQQIKFLAERIALDKEEFKKLHDANAEKIEKLEKKIGYYDRMALKWGSLCIGFVSFGALVSMGADKIKEKLLHFIAAW